MEERSAEQPLVTERAEEAASEKKVEKALRISSVVSPRVSPRESTLYLEGIMVGRVMCYAVVVLCCGCSGCCCYLKGPLD